ncbi:histidine phosphatase family protein [Oscillochloris sp. ZM17-4]|uniref:histidine phosphatase family protein n=1 Tax=Oscillochloris sp. ZM17-4 TaxID=2866714 RepID=UPI001C734740|nr:histidine phosphatase family protein [Oscillochloris sp. ZM17-4]MBX0326573.1 histidine phosphatase family protein [Oscillochloris sp. ZM17-4]
MRLILVRHGETPWNVTLQYQGQVNVPLNDRGRAQARHTAERLARLGADALYTSDTARAAETAAIIGSALGRTPAPMPELREIDVGQWEGLTPEQLYRRFPDHMAEYERDPARTVRLGGESYAQLQARALVALGRIYDAHQPGDVIVAVSHGGTIRALLCHVIGLELANFGKMWLDNGSLTEIRYGSHGWRLVRLNDAAHLEGMVAEGGE